jgi:putative DNA primase/helicase
MNLDQRLLFNTPVDDGYLPDKGERGAYKGTIANLAALLGHYGITCQYDNIGKHQRVIFEHSDNEHDLSESGNYAWLSSLISLNNMPQSAANLLPAIMIDNTINPVLDFITTAKRTKTDYFRTVADSLIVDDADKAYRDLALRTWFYQCVAAADSAKRAKVNGSAKFELVLVLQGAQGLGKTTWFKSLAPNSLQSYVATGEHLDPDDTNSLRRCLSTWICELGELDATFRKSDMERLKAFLSQTEDKIRLPYDRAISNYKRRTSFCGSVNPEQFLTDKTGNRRFLPVAVKSITRLPDTEAFLQGFWAQIWHEYTTNNTAIWWASAELESLLQARHDNHAETSPIEELITGKFDLSGVNNGVVFKAHYTATALLIHCGIHSPTKTQIKEVKPFMDKHNIQCVQNNGMRGYWLQNRGFDNEN